MELISIKDTCRVSGGTIITIDGVSVYMDTTGIPNICVTQYTDMMQEMVVLGNMPHVSNTQLMNLMGKHMDIFEASGCDAYLETFSQRTASAYRL